MTSCLCLNSDTDRFGFISGKDHIIKTVKA